MENLKDKLNSIPQDFDREKLWDKIQTKKKKKRFLWIWLFPILLASYFLIPTSKISLNQKFDKSIVNKAQFIEIESNTQENTENTIEDIVALNNSISDKTEAIPYVNDEQVESEQFRFIQNLEVYQTDIGENETIKKHDPLTKTLSEGRFGEGIIFTTADNERLNAHENRTRNLTMDQGLNELNRRDLIGVTPIGQLSLWQTINSNLPKGKLEVRDLEPYLIEREKYDLPFYIRLGAGAGLDNHDYKDANRINEKELESVIVSLELEQFFTKGLSFSGGLSFTRNTTNLRFEEELSNIGFVDGSLINDRHITSYNLYNNYTRFDATLNLKYLVRVEEFFIAPSVGFGYNLSSKVSGEFFEDGSQLIPISSLGYKSSNGSFGEFNLDIGYELKSNIILGISGKVQTSRILDNNEEHSINPIQLTVFAKKAIW